MTILSNTSLKPFNTFGIDVEAKYFLVVNTFQDIQEMIMTREYSLNNHFILGGGSNVLFTKKLDALVIKNNLKGIELVREDDNFAWVKCAAGEIWHQFVLWCIDKNYAGLENLSLIPGCVGASPMQNIGAYGVEIKDSFYELEAIHCKTGEIKIFSKSECEFGYRESIFKRKLKNQFIITSVTFKLSKKPIYNVEYGAIKQELEIMNVTELSLKNISQAVINIRNSKLPNPKVLGNAGSFFKNPEVSQKTFELLKNSFSNIVAYQLDNLNYKLAAGWLIEQCGLKGFRKGNVGVHEKQALVLVNYGGASGNEIYDLSSHVLNSVKLKFGVELEREVNIL